MIFWGMCLECAAIVAHVTEPGRFLPCQPSHPDDPGKLQAFAFGNGYIKALIDAVNSEVQT
jgi:hypothetical protein